MAETSNIPADMLAPGDVVAIEYEIQAGSNQTLLDLAIHQIKQDLAMDPRFDYQGSEIQTRVDKSGLSGSVRNVDYLIVYVQVRKYLRGARPEQQEASIGAIATVTLTALVIAAVAYVASDALRFQSAKVVQRTVDSVLSNPDLTPEQKTDILTSTGVTTQQPKTIGQGIAAFGGSLVTAAIIVAVLWALSLSHRGSRMD